MSSTNAPLPAFFFHGITMNGGTAANLEKALAAQGRALVPLSFATDLDSIKSLHEQVPLAIEQIRSVVACDERFQNGYVFIAFSLGGLIARAVVEEMDDHKVHSLISLAGAQNGVFFGPQTEDAAALSGFLAGFGPAAMPTKDFDYTKYSTDPKWRGVLQADFAKLLVEHPELQNEFAFANIQRSPIANDWLSSNSFLPVINNLKKAESSEELADQERRKLNFLKLKAAHFFASPDDGSIAPWQSSVLGRYSEVRNAEEIRTKYEELTIVSARETKEYLEDTYGLKTLDEHGALFFHEVAGVPHTAWFQDTPRLADPTHIVKFQTLFDEYISKVLP